MAFSTGTIVEINSGGSDSANGGGFDPSATFAADLAATSATGTAPVVTSASYNFVAGDVGHYVFIKSGTNWLPGWYPIASVASNAATLTATIGSVVNYINALPLNTVAGCASTASPTSGTWGIDYSRSASARITYTDMVIDGTTNTKYTSAGNPVGPNVVGNILVVTSGTGFTTQRVVVSSVSGTTATCDKSLGTLSSTGGHGGLGGCHATPGGAWSWANGITSLLAFLKGGNTYTMVNSNNVAGGKITPGAIGQSLVGYTTKRHPYNLDGTRPVIQSNANTFSLVTVQQQRTSCQNIDFENGNANTGIKGFDDGAGWGNDVVWNCKFKSLNTGAITNSGSKIIGCDFESCTTALSTGSNSNTNVEYCTFIGNASVGTLSAQSIVGCVIYGTTGNSSVQIGSTNLIDRCLFHSNTGTGFMCASSTLLVTNSVFYGNSSATAIQLIDGTVTLQVVNCYFGNNSADFSTPTTNQPGGVYNKVVLTGDPCTAASSGDFSPNTTAGAGALVRASAFPIVWANGLTTGALDGGPIQHVAAAAGGLLTHPGMAGGPRG